MHLKPPARGGAGRGAAAQPEPSRARPRCGVQAAAAGDERQRSSSVAGVCPLIRNVTHSQATSRDTFRHPHFHHPLHLMCGSCHNTTRHDAKGRSCSTATQFRFHSCGCVGTPCLTPSTLRALLPRACEGVTVFYYRFPVRSRGAGGRGNLSSRSLSQAKLGSSCPCNHQPQNHSCTTTIAISSLLGETPAPARKSLPR